MPVSTLDSNAALIVIDLQKGITAMPTVHPMAGVIANAVKLLKAFRARSLPVVLVNVTGGAPGRAEQRFDVAGLPSDWSDLIAELEQQPSDYLVTKRTWGAFTNTGLLEILKKEAVTQVVLAGVATSAGVDSTARFASELGFNVTLALDAMTDRTAEAHDYCTTRVFPRLGETGSSDEIIALMSQQAVA